VADMLKRLLQRHPLANEISHPIVSTSPCVVLSSNTQTTP
jgi:hypothetical protein